MFGFPHTTEGAVAMLAAANSTDLEDGRTGVDEQLGVYHSYMVKAERTEENAEKVELGARSAFCRSAATARR
jgi:hypothetical protein